MSWAARAAGLPATGPSSSPSRGGISARGLSPATARRKVVNGHLLHSGGRATATIATRPQERQQKDLPTKDTNPGLPMPSMSATVTGGSGTSTIRRTPAEVRAGSHHESKTVSEEEGEGASVEELLQGPPPSSFLLTAALHLLDAPWLEPMPQAEPPLSWLRAATAISKAAAQSRCVYLLPRSYLQCWIEWAYGQVAEARGGEAPRIRSALRHVVKRYSFDSSNILPSRRESGARNQRPSFAPRNPGPVDASSLSFLGHSLLLRPHVMVDGSGEENDDDEQEQAAAAAAQLRRSQSLSVSIPLTRNRTSNGSDADGDSSIGTDLNKSCNLSTRDFVALLDGVDITRSSAPDSPFLSKASPPKVTACAVSERFYECLRSVHGVLCDDSTSVSFQPPEKTSSMVALYHHVVESGHVQEYGREADSDHAHFEPNARSEAGSALETDSFQPLITIDASETTGSNTNDHSRTLQRSDRASRRRRPLESASNFAVPRPIEFRRCLVPFSSLHGLAPRVVATRSKPKSNSQEDQRTLVEIYPVKLFYSVVDASLNDQRRGSNPSAWMAATQEEKKSEGAPWTDTVALLQGAASKLQSEHQKQEDPRSNVGNQVSLTSKSPADVKKEWRERFGRGDNTGDIGNDDEYVPMGFVLVSRNALATDAAQAILKAAAPDKSSSCVRLWSRWGPQEQSAKSSEATLRRHRRVDGRAPTLSGDGYELVDLDYLAGKNLFGVAALGTDDNDRGGPEGQRPPPKPTITVQEWLQRHAADLSDVPALNRRGTLELLVETRSTPSIPWARESLTLENRLQVGDYVDAQDSAGDWYEAVVKGLTDETVRVHYLGWSSQWDYVVRRHKGTEAIVGCSRNASCPQPLWSHTSRWRESIEVGQEVDVRDSTSLIQRPRWFKGIVRAVGDGNEIEGGAELEALEESLVGNKEGDAGRGRIRRHLLLLNRSRQVLVEVPQEKFNALTPIPPTSTKATSQTSATVQIPAQPPFLRWVNLYGEEVCEANTFKSADDKATSTMTGRKAPATIRYIHDPSRPPVEVLRSFNHGEGFIRESIRGVPPAPGSVGLQNLGNSCFLNSILQCLNHIEPLTKFFLSGAFRSDLNRNNPLGSGGAVALAYASLLTEMWSGEYSTLAPRLLKQTVAAFAPQFNNVYQHDSQEFCSFLMDGIHEDLNRIQNKPYVEELEGFGRANAEVAMESWRKHLLRHDSVIVDHCQGMHRSHVTCPSCGHESIKFDVYSSIPLPVPPAKAGRRTPLSDCLESFTAGEQLDEENAWFCSKCQKHVCALKMIALWSTPDILILHLKRFTFGKSTRNKSGIVRSKREDTVDFPIDSLDMRPYVLGPIDEDAPPVYKLFGVSEHSGPTANSGHYTATVRNSRDGKWYRYNDSHVGMTSGDASITGGAYLLFYQRARGSLRWAGMEKSMQARGVDPRGTDPIADGEGFVAVKAKKKKKGTTSRK